MFSGFLYVISFTSCACVLQNEYVSIVKSSKYDWVSCWWVGGYVVSGQLAG